MATLEQNKKRINALICYRDALINASNSINNFNNPINAADKENEKALLDNLVTLKFRLIYFEKYIKILEWLLAVSEYQEAETLLDRFFNNLDGKNPQNIHERMESAKTVIDNLVLESDFIKLRQNLKKKSLVVKLMVACIFALILLCFVAIIAMVMVPSIILSMVFSFAGVMALIIMLPMGKYVKKYENVGKFCNDSIFELDPNMSNCRKQIDKPESICSNLPVTVTYYTEKIANHQSTEPTCVEEIKVEIIVKPERNKNYFFEVKIPNSNTPVSQRVEEEFKKISTPAA